MKNELEVIYGEGLHQSCDLHYTVNKTSSE